MARVIDDEYNWVDEAIKPKKKVTPQVTNTGLPMITAPPPVASPTVSTPERTRFLSRVMVDEPGATPTPSPSITPITDKLLNGAKVPSSLVSDPTTPKAGTTFQDQTPVLGGALALPINIGGAAASLAPSIGGAVSQAGTQAASQIGSALKLGLPALTGALGGIAAGAIDKFGGAPETPPSYPTRNEIEGRTPAVSIDPPEFSRVDIEKGITSEPPGFTPPAARELPLQTTPRATGQLDIGEEPTFTTNTTPEFTPPASTAPKRDTPQIPVTPPTPAVTTPEPGRMFTQPALPTKPRASGPQDIAEEPRRNLLPITEPTPTTTAPALPEAPAVQTTPRATGQLDIGEEPTASPPTTAPLPLTNPVTTPTPTTTPITDAILPELGGGGGGTPPTTPPQTPTPPTAPPVEPPTTPPTYPTPNEIEGRIPVVLPPTVTPSQPTTQLPGERTVGAPSSLDYAPPTPGSVMARQNPLPTAPTLTGGNLSEALGKAGVGATNLPTTPDARTGNFADYLAANSTGARTPEDIAAEAKRLRDIQVDPERTQIETDRAAALKRLELAMSQADTGSATALNELDRDYARKLQQLQALAIGRGLGSAGQLNSNIPLDEAGGFKDSLYDFGVARGDISRDVQNRINSLRMEAELGDQNAANQLALLERRGGQLEAQSLTDLQKLERQMAEQQRASRFGEFSGIEDISRQRGQDTFNNQAAAAQLSEQIRGNRADEFFKQIGLDQSTAQANFQNQAAMTDLVEGLRQNDIGNNRADLAQYLQTWATRNNVNVDLKRLEDSLVTSELDRALAKRSSEMEGDPNSPRNQLLAAQVQQAQAQALRDQASARRGGLDTGDAIDLSLQLNAMARQSLDKATKAGATPLEKQMAISELETLERQYDSINGAGSFRRDNAPLFEALSTPATSGGGGIPQWLQNILDNLGVGTTQPLRPPQ